MSKNTEVKTDLTPLTTTVSTTSVGYNPLDYLSQGLENDARIGNRINLLTFSIRSVLTSADETNFMRVAVVETRTKLPLSASTYYDTSSVWANPTLGINSGFDYDIVRKVYLNKLYNMQQVITGVDRNYICNHRISFGKLGKKCYYTGDIPATLGANTETHIYLVLLSDSGVSFHPEFAGQMTIRYTDV